MFSASLLDAARQGRADELEQLLRLGASVNEQDYDSAGSALYWACCSGSDEAVRLLLKAGGEVNTPNAHRHSPLHAAADRGHSKIVQLLLQSGASVNVRNSEGLTPLHLAAYRGYSAIVDLLLRSGADMRIRGNDNKTAFHEARAQKHLEVIEAMRHFELRSSTSSFTASSTACIRHSSLRNVAHSAFDDASGPKLRSGWKPELKKNSQHRAQPQPLKKTMSTPPLPCLLTREALPAKRDFAKVSIDPLDDDQDDHDDGVSVLLGNELVSLGMTAAISLIDLLPLSPRNPPRAAEVTAEANATAATAISAAAASSGATGGRRAVADLLERADAPTVSMRRTCTRSLSAHGSSSSRPSGVRCQHTAAKNCTVFCECRLSTSSDDLTGSSPATALGAGSDAFDARRNGKPASTAAVADYASTASTRFAADCRANAADEEQTLSAVVRQDLRFCHHEKLSGALSSGAVETTAEVDAVSTAEAAAASAAAGWAIVDGFSAEPQCNTFGSTESVLSFDGLGHCKQAIQHFESHLLQADKVMRDRTISSQLHRSVSVGGEPTGDPAQRQPGLQRSPRVPRRSSEGLLTVGPSQQPAVSAVLPSVAQRFHAAADTTALADDDFAFPHCATLPPHDAPSTAVDSSTESEKLPSLSDCEAASVPSVSAGSSWLSVGVSYSLVDGKPFAVVRERSGATQLLFRIASVLSFAYTLKVILDLDRKLLVLSGTAGCTASVVGEGTCGLQVSSVPPHPHVARILASYCGDGSNFARLPVPRCRGISSQAVIGECRAGGGRRGSRNGDITVHSSTCDETAGSLLTDSNDTAERRLNSCNQPTTWLPQAGRRIPALFYVMPGGYVHTLSSFIRRSRGTQPSPPYGVDVRVYLRIVYEVLSAAVHLRQTASLCHCAVTPDAVYLTADLHAAVGDVEACVCLRAIDGSLVACDEEALLRGTNRSGNVDYYWWAPELERHVLRSRIGRPPNQPTYAHVLHEKCDTYSIGRTMYAVMGTYSSSESFRTQESTSTIAFPAISRAKLCYSDDETPDLIDGCLNSGCYPPNLRALLRCLVRDAASRPTAAEALAWTAKELSLTCSTAAFNAADSQMSKIGRYAENEALVRQSSAC